MDLSRRQTRAILLATGLIIGFTVAGPAFAALSNLLNPSGVPATGTVPVNSHGAGPNVDVVNAGNLTLTSDAWPNEHTTVIQTDSGNVTFRSMSDANATVTATNITGTYTTVSQLDVASTNLQINPEDKNPINVSGDLDYIKFKDAVADDGNTDFVYKGASGTTTVTVRGLAANTQYRAVDSDGTILDITTSNANGNATFSGMTNSKHEVSIKTGSATPILSNPRPNSNVSTNPSQLSIDVSDEDFPGDNVTLTFKIEGTVVDTVYATSDGTYSTSNTSGVTAGITEWSVIANDSNNNVAIANATFGTPGTLFIRNETNASELVDTPVEVTVRFENGSVITQKSTTDGTIDLSGVGTEDFIVQVNASQDYHQRTVYFPNLVGNGSVYLLNKSVSTVETRFELDDPTGQFPSESFVIIKKAINRSGVLKYRTIHSDRFGTEGVTVNLESNTRYQIYVRSPDGAVQAVGPYRSDVSETVTVRPGSPSIDLGEYSEGWRASADIDNNALQYIYDDPDNATTSVTVSIYEKGNASNLLQPNVTYYSVGNVSANITLTGNQTNTTWVVSFDVDRNGESYVVRREASKQADLIPDDLAREWRLAFGVGILLISAGVFSVLNARVGAVIVALEGGLLWYLGFLTGATSAAGVTLGLFVAVITHAYSKRT